MQTHHEAAARGRVRDAGEWLELLAELGPVFSDRAAVHDREETFVAENYAELRRHRFFSVGVPVELGGGGAGHRELCALLREGPILRLNRSRRLDAPSPPGCFRLEVPPR